MGIPVKNYFSCHKKVSMKVTQEKLPASQIGLEIEIPAEKSKQTYEKVLRNLARSVNLPGFRKGKVPRKVLLQRLGPQRIKATVLEELIQESLQQAVEQESLAVLGNYQLRSNFEELIEKYEPGETLTFLASVDVPPEVNLGDYSNLSVKAEETVYEPKEVDEFLESKRVEQATLIPVEGRPAQPGDVAIVDYQGRYATAEGEEAEELSGAEAKDFQLELEPERFIEGLTQGIEGMNPGETKEIPVTFPEDYPREDLAGKEVIFTVTLKELKEKELPELDDDFAAEVSEFETMAELRESIETQFQEKAERETKNSIESAIVDALVEVAEVELPETTIEREVETVLTQTAMQMQQYGMDVRQLFTKENMPAMRERSRPDAIARLKQSLALLEVAKRESLEVAPEDLQTRMEEVKEQLSDREVDEDKLRDFVTDDLRKEKALDWLREKANVELVPKGSLAAETAAKAAEAEQTEQTETSSAPEAIEVEATEVSSD